MTQEEERELTPQEQAEQAAQEQAEQTAEVVDENRELASKVPDPAGMTGTLDTSGAGAPLVAEQMETLTPGMMADTGHTDELQEVVDRVEGEAASLPEEGGGQAPEQQEVAEEDEDRPAGNASEADWRAYREAHGYTAEELEGQSRDELRDLPDR